LKSAAQVKKEEIPAVYRDVQKRVLVTKGGYTDWEEVLCETDQTPASLTQIQQALKNAGYDPGVIDGVMGSKTKEALKRYQMDNGLPIGNLNMKTLRHLGL